MCRFLRMVVQYSLDERAAELKEYPIGVQVFDRKSDFDPRVDPIVRVEARRLRKKLDDYYATGGADDPIRIELPKGTYAVRFSTQSASREESVPQNAKRVVAHRSGIAVIPFANLGPAEESEYFSDGLTQELILGLTRVAGLRVVAWTSASQLRGEHDYSAIGERLNVAAVLTGSVRTAGNRVRVTAQLIDTADNSYLWSEAYDRQLCDLLQIQDEISRSIVDRLRIHLASRIAYSATRPTVWNNDALNLLFKARSVCSGRTPAGLKESTVLLERALEIEPRFALAWAALADSCTLLADYSVLPPSETVPRAKEAALRALEIDPDLGEAWTSLALISGIYEWDRKEAERCYRRGILLNPGYATVHHWYSSDHLATLGRLDEAEAEIALARQLDPWSTIIVEGVAYLQLLRGKHDAAIATHKEGLAIDPKFYKTYTSIGRVLIQKGQYAEAIEYLEKGRSLDASVPNILGALGQAYALLGNRAKAHEFLAQLKESGPLVPRAIIHIGLGEKEKALDALERACERRETPLNQLRVHPLYDPLRESPRFQAILERIHLS